MQKLLTAVCLFQLLIVTVSETQCSPKRGTGIVYVVTSDKAVYNPGETISFKINIVPTAAGVRCWFLNAVISDKPLTAATWKWKPPAKDFTGYLVEVYSREGRTEKTIASIAVDVSSNWAKYPRYGFLSEFGNKTKDQMDAVIDLLNRHHINGLQFYDWQDKHHQPLAGTVANPAERWKDIAGRECLRQTVKGYIDRAHARGMNAMFYNLCYGALSDAATDAVQPQWYLYNDTAHTQHNAFTLPKPPFKSDILFTDPSNSGWQHYLAAKNSDVYSVFDFDGYHVDQVGERGRVYNYAGDTVDLGAAFLPFLVAMKTAHPGKNIVMNAVNQYGQQRSIATAPVDFLYSELWTGNEGYRELAAAIQNNDNWSNGKSTVLAAYLDYKKAESPGEFNTPGVLLANAVIFSFGGSHIELGEHMLGKEYFPNNNLQMNDGLKKSVLAYYDFLVAYENLLRGGGHFNQVQVTCANSKMNLDAWPPQKGKVSVQGKMVGERQVMHFINFSNAASLEWRDADGNQTIPATVTSAIVEVSYHKKASKVWLASPDINGGVPQPLSFSQTGNIVTFTLPRLEYWDMLVVE